MYVILFLNKCLRLYCLLFVSSRRKFVVNLFREFFEVNVAVGRGAWKRILSLIYDPVRLERLEEDREKIVEF